MFTLDQSVDTVYPGAKMGILVMKGVAYSGVMAESEVNAILENLNRKYGLLDRKEVKELYPVRAYVSYYKKFGHKYHLLAQLESVLKGRKALQSDSGLLQAMFLSELDDMLLTAGHDLAKLHLPLQLRIATGAERYQSISGKEVTTVDRDIMLCDAGGVISSILKGPDYGSRITPSTREALFSIYAPPGIEEEYISNSLHTLEKRISAFLPSAEKGLLKVFS